MKTCQKKKKKETERKPEKKEESRKSKTRTLTVIGGVDNKKYISNPHNTKRSCLSGSAYLPTYPLTHSIPFFPPTVHVPLVFFAFTLQLDFSWVRVYHACVFLVGDADDLPGCLSRCLDGWGLCCLFLFSVFPLVCPRTGLLSGRFICWSDVIHV